MNKIKKVSLFFKILFQIMFIGWPVLIAVTWVGFSGTITTFNGDVGVNFIPHVYTVTDSHPNIILHSLTLLDRLLALCVTLPSLAIELYILYSLINLFKLYQKGEIFSLKNVNYIRNIGYALLLSQLVNPIYEGLMGVVLTRHNPPGHRLAIVTLDHTNVGMVLIALLVILVSWIMAEGCQLHEEQKLTV